MGAYGDEMLDGPSGDQGTGNQSLHDAARDVAGDFASDGQYSGHGHEGDPSMDERAAVQGADWSELTEATREQYDDGDFGYHGSGEQIQFEYAGQQYQADASEVAGLVLDLAGNGDMDDAIDVLQQLAEVAPDMAAALAESYFGAEGFEEEQEVVEHVLPDDVQEASDWINAEREDQQYGQALAALAQQHSDLFPPELTLGQASQLLSPFVVAADGDLDGAVLNLQSAIRQATGKTGVAGVRTYLLQQQTIERVAGGHMDQRSALDITRRADGSMSVQPTMSAAVAQMVDDVKRGGHR